ncbi:MAG: hypothetical protein U0931_12930 [Vulcanimicrobiota bacterium]
MSEQAEYHSSGQFTLDRPAQDQRLGQNALEDPCLAPLWLVRAALEAGADAVSLRLGRQRVELRMRLGGSYLRPALLQRADQLWQLQHERQQSRVVECLWQRSVSRELLRREKRALSQRACFCPVPVKLDGYILQPENLTWNSAQADLLPRDYHLAEFYFAEPGPGLSLFRPDGAQTGRVNSSRTYWRECQEAVERLRWWMPWRVAGQVARLKACQGWRFGWAGLLSAGPGQRGQAVAVHQGVTVWRDSLNWPELGGVYLLFDASDLPLDLSALKLVESLALRGRLEHCRQALVERVRAALPRWGEADRGHGVASRQNRKEAGAWLSVWSLTLVTGVAMYLPLPLLGLPWIVWHHRSRRRIFQMWQARLQELGTVRIEPSPGG